MRHKNKRYTAPDRVEFGYSFQIALGIWERIGVDVSLKPGETIEGKLSEMQERLQQFHKRTNPQLYQNGTEALVNGFGYGEKEIQVTKTPHDKRIQDIIQQINLCSSVEVLKQFKMIVSKNAELQTAYDKKMEELP